MTNIEQIKREVFKDTGYDETCYPYTADALDKAIDYLHSRGYFGGVPDGYVLVPKEPTENMRHAGMMAFIEAKYAEGMTDAYKAMISAVPKGKTK